MDAQDVIQTASLLLVLGLVARLIGDLVRLPEIVLMVALGVLAGPSGLDLLDVPLDSIGAQLILTVGVGLILFYGGMGLSLSVLGRVRVGLGMLVIPGVVITAAVTGVAAALAFGLPADVALLMGAVLAPTDPAILIPLFARMRVRAKVSQTVIAESAFNDPTGAILALAVAGVVLTGEVSYTGELESFIRTLIASVAVGIVVGFALAISVSSHRAGIWRESPAIAALAAVSAGYFSLETLDGSGYLGAFVAGLIVGNMEMFGLGMNPRQRVQLQQFTSELADVVTMLIFLTLGANLPLGEMRDHLGPGVVVVAVLIFVARPLAVYICTLPDRSGGWTSQERLFLCWTRETGVVPAALAGILVADRVPHAPEIVSVVAMAVVGTLLVQATTTAWLADRLRLIDAEWAPDTAPAVGVASPP
jgi:potassium/hydrogen antiporter